MRDQVIFIKGIDVDTMIHIIETSNKRMQAILLSFLEQYFDDATFPDVRKKVLDTTNDYTRNVVRTLIGDVESV